VTYKGGTAGDVPVTDGLIKGFGVNEHTRLLKEEKQFWLRAVVPSKTRHPRRIDSESKLEAEQIE
jgi:hypothetical protein